MAAVAVQSVCSVLSMILLIQSPVMQTFSKKLAHAIVHAHVTTLKSLVAGECSLVWFAV